MWEHKWTYALALGACVALLLVWHLPPPARPARPRPAPPAIITVLIQLTPVLFRDPAPPNVTSHTSDPPPAPSPDAHAQETDRIVFIKDLYEPGYLWPHAELCGAGQGAGEGVELLVLVTSAPAHARARRAVRLTWGHHARRRDVVIAFVLGRAPPPLMQQVAEEDALYGDIIMGASWDTYRNLTLKTLSLMEWAAAYCPRARRLLKTDDDMFINVPRLLALLADPARVNDTTTIWGRIAKKWYPFRNPTSKYYLSLEQFPDAVLPDFATGPAYALSGAAAARLAAAAPAHRFVPLEDLCFTGLLADTLRLRRQHESEFYNKRMPLEACVVQRGVAIHQVEYHEQFDLWRKLNDEQESCA